MLLVSRQFSQIYPIPDNDALAPKPLSAFFHLPALVILGDPGMGKTEAFKLAEKEEDNAKFITVRDFLVPLIECTGKTLYLDAMDEMRAGSSDGRTTLDAIRNRIAKLGKPHFRLSCRAMDWFGASDQEALKAVSSSGAVSNFRQRTFDAELPEGFPRILLSK
jgi:hypothetical protein